MKRLLLERFAYSPESTEGELFLLENEYSSNSNPTGTAYKQNICWTLELPWLNNTPSISCIPEGSYWIAPHTRPDGRFSFIVWGDTVSQAPDPGEQSCPRWGILFHAANRPAELQGCIAPGLERKPGKLLKSALAMLALKKATKDSFETHDRMVLTIRQRQTEAVI